MNSASGDDGAAVAETTIGGNALSGIKPYFEKAPLAALFLGISSGLPYSMVSATMSSWLSDNNIDIKSVTQFALVLLVYNFKFAWAWVIEGVRIPLLGRLGQRVSWMILAGFAAMFAIIYLGQQNPAAGLGPVIIGALLVAIAGATYDIVIDGYRIELLEPRQLGVGAGMSQYGWRIGSQTAAALALVLAQRWGWDVAYGLCSTFALSGVVVALVMGEPQRHIEPREKKAAGQLIRAIVGPLMEFFKRRGAFLVLAFVLLHKIGDTLANLTLRPLFKSLGYSKDEIAVYDVGVGFWAFLVGIFLGGILYSRMGLKRSVMISLWLMAFTNLSFAGLAAYGHNNWAMAGAIGFESMASGIGGVCVVAYFSALCDLRFTAAQYALISAAASIIGRLVTGTAAGRLIDAMGFVNYYIFTTVIAFPGIVLFWFMVRAGLIEQALGTAAEDETGHVVD